MRRSTNIKFTGLIILLVVTSGAAAQNLLQKDTSNYRYYREQRGLEDILHSDENGLVRPDLYRRSVEEFKQIRSGQSAYLGATVQWNQIGPAPATVNTYLAKNGQLPGPNAGAVIDIVIDPSGSQDMIAYAIANSGGVWKTTDGGNLWLPKTDTLATLSFGALALDPSNPQIVYAGTGNPFNNGYYSAIGIYVSNDAGESWTKTLGDSVLNGIQINKMIVPVTGTILVASKKGLFRSTDSGTSYARVMINEDTTGYITDLDMLEGGTTIWASVYGQGIYMSIDSGASFGTNLWGPGNGDVPKIPYEFVSLGVSSDGNTMYANAELDTPQNVGVWKSIDGGDWWEDISENAVKTVPGLPKWRQVSECQCGYDQTLGVDPADANRVYMGFQDMWLSEDGGNAWKDVSWSYEAGVDPFTVELMHVDHHALRFSPSSHRTAGQTTRVWVGNDGGIWSSQNAGVNWKNHNVDTTANPDASFATNLFRGIDTGRGANNNNYTYGGMQDTGTAAGSVLYTNGNPQPWNEWLGGDGYQTAVDWTDPKNAYGMWLIRGRWSIGYTNDGGGTYSWSVVSCWPSGDPNSFSELETGPTNQYVYLAGACNTMPTLFFSTDSAKNFAPYYQFSSLTGSVRSIGVTPANSDTVYVSLSTGSMIKLTNSNGRVDTTDISISNGMKNQVPQLAINQKKADMLVAVFPGYSQQKLPAPSKHVYLSIDAGETFKDISGTIGTACIPDIPIYAAVFDPNTTPNSILVASDLGVFRTYDFGLTWHVAGTDLPFVHTTDLEIDATVNPSLIKAGTYGRSTWNSTLPVNDEVFGQILPNVPSVKSMFWQNTSNEVLDISWVAQNGSQTPYGNIPADGSLTHSAPMYYTGVTVVRDSLNNVVLAYVVNGNANQNVLISQEAVNAAKTSALKGFPGLRSSPNQTNYTSNFTAKNNSSQALNINTVSTEGISQFLVQLGPGDSTTVTDVYFGGAYTFSTVQEKVVGIYIATDAPNQEMSTTDQFIEYWK
ncbi:MAG: hypothetical protein ABJF11_19160 [Reichenbachiella sp.]|uniref:hypothetical protein n=1 Tax=Reichenbachiella sp. TaxID=2184521 RepID=UPI003265A517